MGFLAAHIPTSRTTSLTFNLQLQFIKYLFYNNPLTMVHNSTTQNSPRKIHFSPLIVVRRPTLRKTLFYAFGRRDRAKFSRKKFTILNRQYTKVIRRINCCPKPELARRLRAKLKSEKQKLSMRAIPELSELC